MRPEDHGWLWRCRSRAIQPVRIGALSPFIHMFKVWAGIDDHDARDEAPHKLQRLVSAIAHDTTTDVFSFLATMMGFTLSGPAAGRLPVVEGDALARLILSCADAPRGEQRSMPTRGRDRRLAFGRISRRSN